MTIALLVVTVVSVAVAATTSVAAWRLARQERRRSEARVAALAAAIYDSGSADVRPRPVRESVAMPTPAPRRAVVGVRAEPARVQVITPRAIEGGDLFVVARPAGSGSRAAVIAAGVLVICGIAAVAVVWSGGPTSGAVAPRATRVEAAAQARSAATAGPVPLELVALGHDRDGDRLTVRGMVRNPRAGAPVTDLTAVVFAFARDGDFTASGRAALAATTLAPGGEAPFVVVVPGVSDVGRYRVSFRTDVGVVPHVDRRDRPAVARIE